ncbi:chlorophyllase [Streptomyces chartreusis]|uniref:alpha/beta hydrolase family protein n=1 Tax=Streptomyces chartreusis TaxID=1969 RepID=UPI002F90B3E7|nr:chlorophyllase [Streptomyces chartreusis]WTA33565.1 chlorophyllase [Streptomyces chartreusis]
MIDPVAAAATLGAPVPVLSYSPLVLPVPGRPVDLQVRVTAPESGTGLPVILFSHGGGPSNNLSSLNGYAPLVNFWAAHGFVVIQPTHLTSKTLSHLVAGAPGAPSFWRSRSEDMSYILDRLEMIEKAVPLLAGRIDHSKVTVAGHSFGGFTSSLLLGAQVTDPDAGEEVSLLEPRIKAGVLLASPGRGNVITGPMGNMVPVFRTLDFSTMTTPALVVAGDQDDSRHFTDMGPDWHADPYVLAPSPKTLLTLFGAGHALGGIPGYDVVETTDESPERVASVGWLTSAYLLSQLEPGANTWQTSLEALEADPTPVGRVEVK